MTDAAPAAVTEATTPQAAPKDLSAGQDAPPPVPGTAGTSEAASEAEAKKEAAPAAETPEQRQKRVEAAGKRARREAARNRELQAQIARQQAELQQAQHAQRELERIEALKKDKWAAARELGIDPRELAQQALKEGTPEYQAELERQQMREELAALKRRDEERDQQILQQRAIEQNRRNIAGFIEASKAYPDVAKLPERARIAWARDLIAEAKAEAATRGLLWEKVAPTDAKILRVMQESLAGVPASPAKAPDTDSTPDAKANGSASPQTVTSKVASQKFSLPANWDSLSDEQQKSWIAQQLEQASTRKK